MHGGGGEVILGGIGITGNTALVIEVGNRIVLLLIEKAFTLDRWVLGILVSVGDYRTKPHKRLGHDAASLGEHLITNKLIPLFLWDDVLTLNYIYAVIDPVAAVSAKLRELVHTEPKLTVVGIIEG